jgi:hypothetical protein
MFGVSPTALPSAALSANHDKAGRHADTYL